MINQEKADIRKAHWENVFRRKSPNELSWYSPHLRHSLALIEQAHLPKESPIIDVGAGDSTLVDDLLEKGYLRVTLLDISSEALEKTRLRLDQRASMVQWIVADISSSSLEGQYDLWHDRAVFHFLTDARDRRAYVENLRRAVKPGGYVVIATFSPTGPDRCSGLPTMRYSSDALLAELGPSFHLIETRDDAHITPAGKNQDFLYCLFHRKSAKPDER